MFRSPALEVGLTKLTPALCSVRVTEFAFPVALFQKSLSKLYIFPHQIDILFRAKSNNCYIISVYGSLLRLRLMTFTGSPNTINSKSLVQINHMVEIYPLHINYSQKIKHDPGSAPLSRYSIFSWLYSQILCEIRSTENYSLLSVCCIYMTIMRGVELEEVTWRGE